MSVDKVLRCRDCGTDFLFSAGEQEFYAMKGLMNEPGRCYPCRAQRRSARAAAPETRYGAAPSDRPRREMHTVTCAQCDQPAQVPFVPRGDRPVYCSTCFDRVRSAR